MADMYFKPRLFRQSRQPEFPNFTSISVTAAATARYQKLFRAGKGVLADTAPPPGDAFHREIRRVVACSHIDKSRVVVPAKHAVRRDFPQLFYREVMTRHFSRVFAPAILRAGILEVPGIFLLLGICRDYRFVRLNKRFRFRADDLKNISVLVFSMSRSCNFSIAQPLFSTW
jgi:hypothetical protein